MSAASAQLLSEQLAADPAAQELPEADRLSWWSLSTSAWVALLVGLVVTVALSLTSLAVYNRNERRLVNVRVRELGLVLAGAAPSIETPLTSAAALVSATGGIPRSSAPS